MSLINNEKNEEIRKLTDENNRLKKSIEDLWTINQLARIISSTISVNKILDKVVSVSVKALGAEQGTISLLHEHEEHEQFKTLIRKVDQTHFTKKYRLDDDLSGWMIKNHKPLLINDFDNDTTFKGKHKMFEEIHSILSVPLLCKGELIGVLNVFNKKDKSNFSTSDQRLLSIIATQSAQVIENARLYEEEKQLRLIEKELETARSIQLRLLPKENPRIAGFDISGISFPAKEVGGDYFDFIELENQRWGIALGDVSGKGVPAALLMSNLQATLRNQALSHISLLDCIIKANQFLYRNTEDTKFVTLFCGVLDAKSKTFNYVNAGHNFPYYLDKQDQFHPLEIGGLVLGILPDCPFDEGKVELHAGEIIVIFSDGVTEAENELEDLFGEQRLRQIIRENKELTANQIINKIYNGVNDFAGGKSQYDDITMVVIKAN
ncbi:MAG: GAF domain-containing SpoIIE family protein phosphatase [bacterium]